ncbi:hypothetical protein [Halomonas sp. 328]|nr:hypothetical protein [Halomonas sp. 328]MBF8224013.1 hypothetical protein [Halomonas sp. 328]
MTAMSQAKPQRERFLSLWDDIKRRGGKSKPATKRKLGWPKQRITQHYL